MLTDHDMQRLRDVGHSEEKIREIVLEDQLLDEKIQQAAYQEWLDALVRMWDAVDKDVDEKRLMVYAEEFAGVPLGLLEVSVKRAIRNNGKYLSVPSIGAVWNEIRKETGDLPHVDVMEAVALWKERQSARFDAVIYRFEGVVVETDAVHASA